MKAWLVTTAPMKFTSITSLADSSSSNSALGRDSRAALLALQQATIFQVVPHCP
jgi:hypothetical protein